MGAPDPDRGCRDGVGEGVTSRHPSWQGGSGRVVGRSPKQGLLQCST